MSVLIDIRDLHTHFALPGGRVLRAVDGVSLQIERCSIMGLVGESGSGKSTLGKTLTGLLERTAGEIFHDGEALPARFTTADFRRHARAVQMIFQDPQASLNPRMTVQDIVCEPLRLRDGGAKREHRALAASWLERVGLATEHLQRYPHEFSGGQRQRIGIARALIGEPRFVVCDEPISALDVSVQAQIVNLLADLQASLGLSLLFIAHDLSMVRHLADRMAVMYHGSLVEEGPARQLSDHPLHPYTRLLVSSNPVADPRIEKLRAHAASAVASEAANYNEGCRFAARCPQADQLCRKQTPPLRIVDTQRKVACHHI